MAGYGRRMALRVAVWGVGVAALSAALVSFGPGSALSPFGSGARAEGAGLLDQQEAAQMAASLGDGFLLDTLSSGKAGGNALLKDGRPYTTADLENAELLYDEGHRLWVARWELTGVVAPNWDGEAVLSMEIGFDNGGVLRFADAGLHNPNAVADEQPVRPNAGTIECQPLDSGFDGAPFCFGKA